MGQQIIKQPNGLYALFSSVVDDFIMVDATPQDIIDEWIERETNFIKRRVEQTVTELEEGNKPYHQFTMTFDEAVKTIKDIHGADAESLKMLGL